MKPRTEEHFKSELEAARKALRDNGRDVSVGDRVGEEAGISCDF